MPQSLQDLYDELRMTHVPRGRGRAAPASPEGLIQLLFSYGAQARTTDIHIEPTPQGARIRYRIDGVLHEMLRLPQEISELLIRAIKVKANMATDIVGRSKPQDSRMDFTQEDGRKLDLRLSSFPTVFGDMLAIRILDRSAPMMTLDQLGCSQAMLNAFKRLIRAANGLILVVGTANSGKTTTLYAALDKLRSAEMKIITLEDPVEYQMEGLDQAQINLSFGLTFASGLRAILRQDVNIVLVGEVRDQETVEITIRAALSGPLVFSTMHTRHSCGAVTRLMDMGIEPHLIVASVNGILAQRLVRLTCPSCKAPDPTAAKAFLRLWTQETSTEPPAPDASRFSKGIGCAACNRTGYQGRTGIFELLVLTDELKRLIVDQASARLYKTAVASGMRTMLLDGLEKASQGLTTVEEVLRVTGETEDFS